MEKTNKNVIKKLHLRKLKYSDNAVVGIVVAVLLIGLMVSVISIIQAAYIPKWMEEKEADHIEQVLVQFSELKLAIDTHSINRENNTPIATSITLGSKEFPFLMSTRAYGSIEIIDDECTINIIHVNRSSGISTPLSYDLGIIIYNSYNAYYIPQEMQSFVYEAGAVITNQTSGNSISIRPPFNPTPNKISFKIIDIASYAEKTAYGGYDTVPILTEFDFPVYDDTITDENSSVSSISIKTSYTTAWYTFFNSSLKKAGFISSDYTVSSSGDTVSINFLTYFPDLELTEIGILAQIGPGWVE